MKTKKDAVTPPATEATLAGLADTLLAPLEPLPPPAPLVPVRIDSSGEQYMYFTERDIDRILDNLDGLRSLVFPPAPHDEENDRRVQHFPSVCLIGLGRCGSNIALDVASLVYNARQFYLSEFKSEEKTVAEQDFRPTRWIRSNLLRAPSKDSKPVFLIEPLVMLGDLDKDIEGRIRFSRKGETSGHRQRLVEARLDCDGDAVLLLVEQQGPACHTGRPNCFYNAIRNERVCVISVPQ